MNFSYFPYREFTQALAITSKVKVRLVPFVTQIEKNNVEWMFHMFSEIYVYTVTPDADINFKFNALVALKLLLDTCEFSILLITEVYFLAHIRKVSTYQLHLQEKQRGLDYFTTQGYPKSQHLRKLGYNYVRLACEIVTMLSVIKPYRLYRNEQLPEPSEFANILEVMKAQQWKQYDSLAFYSENSVKMREHYLNKLEEFQENSHYYYNFFETFLDKLLRKEYSPKGLDPKKILESSEVYSCNFVLQVLKQMAFQKKATTITNVLKLMTEFIRWGYIRAFYVIEVQRIFDNLIAEVKTQSCNIKSLERGKYLFKDIEASEEEKKLLYCELMKSIQIWAVCIPKNLINQSSKSRCSTIYKELIEEFGLEFPPPGNIKKTKNQCNENLEKNQQINRLSMKELQNCDFELMHMKRTSSDLRELLKMDSNLVASLKTIISDAKLISRRKIGHHSKDPDEDSESEKERQRVSNKTYTPIQVDQQSKVSFSGNFCYQRNLNRNRHRTGFSYSNKENHAIANQSARTVASDRLYNSIRLTTLPSQEEPSQSEEQSLEENILDEEETDYSEEYEENSEVKQLRVLKSVISLEELKSKGNNKGSIRRIPNLPENEPAQKKISRDSSKIQFFEEECSSNSSFNSHYNNFDLESLNPKITINCITHHHIRDDSDDCSATFKKLDKDVEQYKVKSVKFFKKTPTVKEYQELEVKVHNLETEKSKLKSQLMNKDKELQRIKKGNSSCSSFKDTTQLSWSEPSFDEETHPKTEKSKPNKQSRGSNQSSYVKGSRFFSQLQNFNILGIKKLLKDKDLLLRNQRLQIGYIFIKEEYSYELTLFITPEKSMTKINWKIEQNECLQAYLQSQTFVNIGRRKQKKIVYQFQINSPYKLPYFTLIYEMDSNQYQQKLILPVSFNKFVEFRSGELHIQGPSLIRKTNIDVVNKRYFKHISNYREYFCGLEVKEKQKEEIVLKGVASFQKQEMGLKIILQGEDFFQIECQVDRHDKPLIEKTEFLMMTMLNLIRK